jgi:hypothetical protein
MSISHLFPASAPLVDLQAKSITIPTGAAVGKVLTCTDSSGHSQWETGGGGGGVASVTAGDATITVGGTPTNPTIEASGNFLTKPITTGGLLTADGVMSTAGLFVTTGSTLDDGNIFTNGSGSLSANVLIATTATISSVVEMGSLISDGFNITTNGLGDIECVSVSANSLVAGDSFALTQRDSFDAYTGSGMTVNNNGASGVVTLTGFVLNSLASTLINVNNSAVTADSVILLTAISGAVIPATAGFTVELNSSTIGSFAVVITNLSLTSVTSGNFSFSYITC